MENEVNPKPVPNDPPLAKGLVRRGLHQRWYIFHPWNITRAWSGSRWVPCSSDGFPTGDTQVCNFDTEQAALDYLHGES